MIHLRLILPAGCYDAIVGFLREDPRVTHVIVLPGAAVDPPGDVVLCDVAREAASEIIATLKNLGLRREGAIAIEQVDATSSATAAAAERAAPGAGEDGIVWDMVLSRARDDSESSWSFYAFLTLATLIAAVAVILDSSILVVGAMVVGPEFGPVAAICVGLVLRRRSLVVRSLRLLALGFAAAIAVTTLISAGGELAGWISAEDVTRERPLTGFIWAPDRWSLVVALLAGAAGVLSLTAGRSSALVGVFISVTTVPAAGNLALALALRVPDEIGGAALQLLINLVGMVVSGTAVLALQRMLTRPEVRAARARGRTRLPAG